MELTIFSNKAVTLLKKYRFVAIILVIGLLLMTFPLTTSKEAMPEAKPSIESQEALENQLAEILGKIHGAGRVEVLLSIASSEEVIYQTDLEETTNEDSSKIKTDTITVTDDDRNQSGLVRKRISPDYLGAIIVCQGADNPEVRLSIVDAVSKLTGLGANKISVLKMK